MSLLLLLLLTLILAFALFFGGLALIYTWTTLTFPTTGSHTLRVQVREDGVQFDQIVLSPSTYLNAAPGPVANDNTIVAKP